MCDGIPRYRVEKTKARLRLSRPRQRLYCAAFGRPVLLRVVLFFLDQP